MHFNNLSTSSDMIEVPLELKLDIQVGLDYIRNKYCIADDNDF